MAKTTKTQPSSNMSHRPSRRMPVADQRYVDSRTAVLETTELLENVLSYLFKIDILINAQSVSPYWNTLVAKSPQIQLMPWGPRDTRLLSPSGQTHEIAPTQNDAAATVFFDSSDREMNQTIKLATGMPIYSAPAAFKPLFPTEVLVRQDASLKHLYAFSPCPPIGAIGVRRTAVMSWIIDIYIGAPGKRPSWFDQYITSPPIKAAQLCVYSGGDSRWVSATVYDPNGITYGIAAEALQKMGDPFLDSSSHFTPMMSFIAN